MTTKRRLSATVDADVLAAAEQAAAYGEAPTISAWVNDALRLKLEHDRRLQALRTFIAEEEAQHGVITDEEIAQARRAAAGRARVVRGRVARPRGARTRRARQ
ncbi:MAG TPA: hypothetical protein VGQ83_04645 [Polyangia bacterium]|jgi:hypothetical protein